MWGQIYICSTVAITPQLHYLYRNGIGNALHCFDASHWLVQREGIKPRENL